MGAITKILGFASFYELVRQMFKPHKVKLSLLINLSITFTMLFLFTPVLEEYVWSPFWTLILLCGVVILDFISAVGANKKGFITAKAIKVPITIAAYVVLLAILNGLGKAMTAFELDHIFNPVAFDYLAKSVWFLCVSINLVSALKHMSNMGIIPRPVAKFIEKFIDTQKNKIEATINNIETPAAPENPGEAPNL